MRYYDNCLHCGGPISYQSRGDKKYCCDMCRQAAYRKRKSGSVTATGRRNRGMIKQRRTCGH